MTISQNVIAPNFALPDENGRMYTLNDFKGKSVVLYFYPKDSTPGCTTEACSFRDDYSNYKDTGIEIIGISADSAESHLKFKTKYKLPFILLSDKDHKVSELYGVWGKKKFIGREFYGILRTTFLINKRGEIFKVFEGVKPTEHSAEVLLAFKNNK